MVCLFEQFIIVHTGVYHVSGLSSILFALSIDRAELNDTQQASQLAKPELVIPVPTPMKPNSNMKRKPLRQVISFDKSEQDSNQIKDKRKSLPPTEPMDDSAWNSAPPTCLNSPDPVPQMASSTSEPTSSEYKSGIRHFFPDSMRAMESLSKLSERAKVIFSSSHSIDTNNSVNRDDFTVSNLKISESDSEEVAGSIDGSTSCLELCFTEDESGPEDRTLQAVLEMREKEYLALQMKYNEVELGSKEKILKLEKVVLDLSK